MSLASTSGTIQFLKRGKAGRTPKFMGVYSPDVTYTSDDYVAPFVLNIIYNVAGDPTSGIKSTDYYIMFGDNYAWTGKNEKTTPWEEAAKQNNVEDKRWSLFAGFSTIAAEIAFIRFGLMAGAVMCQEGDARNGYTYAKMFSQTGEDGTTNYEKFDPSKDAWDSTQSWMPNACIDWKTGKTWFKDTTIAGNVTASKLKATEGGQIGPFEISSDELASESLYNDGNTGSNGLKQYLRLKSDSIYFGVTGGDISAEIGINSGSIWSGYQGCAAFYNNLKHTFEGDIKSNNGIYIEVSGANKYDNSPGAGNHALFLAKGDVVGFRPYARRIDTDGETLSIYDTLVFVIKSGINIYLPSAAWDNVEDGQFYMIVNTSGSKIRITGTFAGTTKFVDLSSWHMGFFTYDAVNRYWCGVFSAHF